MTTIVNANGVTVVVPVPSQGSGAEETKSCASGWFLCGAEAGPVAGCCPSGYGCGTASCSVVADGGATATVAKELPGSENGGSKVGRRGGGWLVVGVVLGVMEVLV